MSVGKLIMIYSYRFVCVKIHAWSKLSLKFNKIPQISLKKPNTDEI